MQIAPSRRHMPVPGRSQRILCFIPHQIKRGFYASRVSTGTGVGERMFVDGYLIGSPIPTPGAAGTMVEFASAATMRRRRMACTMQ
jgi:hypothetical protein